MGRQLIDAQNLTRVFGSGRSEVRAVDGVDLQVAAGELLLVMGPSGSGKTTLLTLIGGLLRPTTGRVSVNGTEITELEAPELAAFRRQNIGFIFQSFNLLESLSVVENVELALNIAGVGGNEARRRAERILIEMGLEDRLSFRTRDLSGGEKQRVSAARALVNNPPIVLADEPTANLDSIHGREIMDLLRHAAREGSRAVVVVSHDQRIREVADRVLWLEDGRLREMGRLVRDPVCGMAVEIGRAVALTYEGRRYYFCANGCRTEFSASPGAFAGEAAGVTGTT